MTTLKKPFSPYLSIAERISPREIPHYEDIHTPQKNFPTLKNEDFLPSFIQQNLGPQKRQQLKAHFQETHKAILANKHR